MTDTSLEGRSVVIIGASSGVGKGIAERCIGAGAQVILAARRIESLLEITDTAGGGHAVATDLRDDDSCRRLAQEIAAVASPIDLVVISAGVAPLRRLEHTTLEDWQDALSTNLIGIHRIIVELLEQLSPSALVAVISSEAASTPRSHLGAYGASKAALEHMLAQWQEEHPSLRFTTVSLGATTPTEFGKNFASETILEAFSAWTSAGRTSSAFMNTGEICEVLTTTLTSLLDAPSIGMPRIEFRSPAPPETDQALALEHASHPS
jgi:NAD(P)-dependent dehydrogenase (short-subunit alcohol dehydrogenase family)